MQSVARSAGRSSTRTRAQGLPSGTSAPELVVTINTINGSPPPASITNPTTIVLSSGAGGNCMIVGSGETCTAIIPAPPGSVNYTFKVLNANGTTVASVTVTLTVQNGGTGNAPITLSANLSGVVNTLAVTAGTLTLGSATSLPLTVTAKDPDGNPISGTTPYASPVTLTDNDATGTTALTVNGGTPATTVLLHSPADTVKLTYNGNLFTTFSLVASAPNATNGSTTITGPASTIVITGTTIDTLSPNDINFEQPTLFFSSIPSTSMFSASEAGYTGTFTVTQDPTTCGTGGSAVATIATTNHTTFNVTAQNPGICKATVTDTFNNTAVVWFSVGTANFGISAVKRK